MAIQGRVMTGEIIFRLVIENRMPTSSVRVKKALGVIDLDIDPQISFFLWCLSITERHTAGSTSSF